jgi:hypothetical protein
MTFVDWSRLGPRIDTRQACSGNIYLTIGRMQPSRVCGKPLIHNGKKPK